MKNRLYVILIFVLFTVTSASIMHAALMPHSHSKQSLSEQSILDEPSGHTRLSGVLPYHSQPKQTQPIFPCPSLNESFVSGSNLSPSGLDYLQHEVLPALKKNKKALQKIVTGIMDKCPDKSIPHPNMEDNQNIMDLAVFLTITEKSDLKAGETIWHRVPKWLQTQWVPRYTPPPLPQDLSKASPLTSTGSRLVPPSPSPQYVISCRSCNEHMEQPKTCGRCRTVFYCSPQCQRLDWKNGHKSACPTQKIKHDQNQKVADIVMQYHKNKNPNDKYLQPPNLNDLSTQQSLNTFLREALQNNPQKRIPDHIENWVIEKWIPDQQAKANEQKRREIVEETDRYLDDLPLISINTANMKENADSLVKLGLLESSPNFEDPNTILDLKRFFSKEKNNIPKEKNISWDDLEVYWLLKQNGLAPRIIKNTNIMLQEAYAQKTQKLKPKQQATTLPQLTPLSDPNITPTDAQINKLLRQAAIKIASSPDPSLPLPDFRKPEIYESLLDFCNTPQHRNTTNMRVALENWMEKIWIPDQQANAEKLYKQEQLKLQETKARQLQLQEQEQLIEEQRKLREIEREQQLKNRSNALVVAFQNLQSTPKSKYSVDFNMRLEQFEELYIRQNYKLYGTDKALEPKLESLAQNCALLHRPNNPGRKNIASVTEKSKPTSKTNNKQKPGNGKKHAGEKKNGGSKQTATQVQALHLNRLFAQQSTPVEQLPALAGYYCDGDRELFRGKPTDENLQQPPQPAPELEDEAKAAAELVEPAAKFVTIKHGDSEIHVNIQHIIGRHLIPGDPRLKHEFANRCYKDPETRKSMFPCTWTKEYFLEKVKKGIEENSIVYPDRKGLIIAGKLGKLPGDTGPDALEDFPFKAVIPGNKPGIIETCFPLLNPKLVEKEFEKAQKSARSKNR